MAVIQKTIKDVAVQHKDGKIRLKSIRVSNDTAKTRVKDSWVPVQYVGFYFKNSKHYSLYKVI